MKVEIRSPCRSRGRGGDPMSVIDNKKNTEITRLRSENKRLRAELKIALSYLRAARVNVEVCIGAIDEGVKRISDALQETDNG
jgi:hypothetical protein